VFARGIERQSIFRDPSDRQSFLSILAGVADKERLRCHAYCLMGNHYHLTVEVEGGNLSDAMRDLNGIYAQRFNRRHERTGHVFEGRFESRLVDTEAYLLEVVRYVLLNPVRSGAVARAEDWLWSSYRATMGLTPAPRFLTVDLVLGLLSPDTREARQLLRAFVEDGDPQAGPEGAPGPVIGTSAFVRQLAPRLRPLAHEEEFPRRERLVARPSLEELFASAGSRSRAVRAARLQHGYRLREIGAHLGLHYSTVSRLCLGSGLEMTVNARPDPKFGD
jgi:REP element-mobilizing transposase RayT